MSKLSATHFQPPGGTWTDENTVPHLAAMKAAHERCKAYARFYARTGKRAHLSPPWGHFGYVLCGRMPGCLDDWLGTGSQAEYELAAELETCALCRRLFMDTQRCGNPECPCQKWVHLRGGESR